MRAPWLLVLLVAVSGCLGPDAGSGGLSDADPGEIPPGADGEGASVAGVGCMESQVLLSADPGDFEDGLPAGFTLVLDDAGQATIVASARSCDVGGSLGRFLLATVLVEPPAELRRSDADHAVLLEAWIDSDVLHGALRAWNLTTLDARGITMERMEQATLVHSRVDVEPDFVMTVDGTEAVGDVPFGDLRLFDIAGEGGLRALDLVRTPAEGVTGPATVSFIVQPTGGDLPDHRAGSGTVLAPDGGFVLSPVPL